MEYLAENTAPVWVAGGVLLTMALIVYFHTRSTASVVATVLVLLLIGAGLAAEHLIVTQREQVENRLRELLARIEANDLSGVLAMIPSQKSVMAADAQTLMPLFEVHKARATGEVKVVLVPTDPPSASAGFHFFTDVRHKRSGLESPYFDEVTINFIRENDEWMIDGYSTGKDWRKDASRL